MALEGTPDNMAWHTYRHVTDDMGSCSVQRVHDGAWIIKGYDPTAGAWGRYTRWLAAGNIPQEVDLRTTEGQLLFAQNDIEASLYHKIRKDANDAAFAAVQERVAAEKAAKETS